MTGVSTTAKEPIMADDTTLRGTRDRSRVNLEQDHEVDYWTQTLGCTEAQLRAAVQQVGSSAEKVREYLGTTAA
jgi:hypothetical protein